MAKTVKEAKADIFLRDTDSQSLFNNSGVLSFKYYHEWNDCYNPITDETAQINGEVYDETTDSYKPNCPEGFNPVFNGRQSALWDNIVNCFPDKVREIYVKMRGNGLTYQDMLTKYKDFWKYWCENLYNADAFGYANTNNFTKAYGDKVQVMDYFYGKRQRYLDSKYHCGSSISNNLRLRMYEVGRGFAIKHYQAIYCTLHWGSDIDDNRNIKPGTYSYMPFKFSNPQDATFDIDDADLITELSTFSKGSNGNYIIYGLEGLGDIKFDLNMGLLKRLTKFVMNYTASKPNTKEKGDNFDLSNMGMLRQLIVRNVKNLSKSIILSSDLLEEIDFTNTPITGVTTPPTDMLTKLVLPDTIKELNLVGYTNLEVSGLQVAGYSNIDTLHIENCPNLDTYNICKACYDAGAKLSNVTLVGINWNIEDTNFLMYLTKKGATLKGKIKVSGSVSMDAKRELVRVFGDVDNPNNSLYIAYTPVSINSITISGKSFIYETGEHELLIVPTPKIGNNYKSETWRISSNKFATINKNTGVLTLNSVGTEDNDDKATVSVEVTLMDNTVISASKEIKFYKKGLQFGDYVFANGEFGSSKNDYASTPVGVCFLIDKTVGKALFVACEFNGDTDFYGGNFWGICDRDGENTNISNLVLTDDPYYDVYDIASLPNIIKGFGTYSDSNIVNGDGSFVVNSADTALGDLGYDRITQDIYNELGDLLKDLNINVNSYIARGQLNTLRIIKHRNKILSDSGINKEIPKKQGSVSEYSNLNSLMSKIEKEVGTKYKQYYYPCASLCYAFEPTLVYKEELSPKLSAHHWFLASSGEFARYIWYNSKFGTDSEYNIFDKAYKEGVYKIHVSGSALSTWDYTTSTEINRTASVLLMTNCQIVNSGVYNSRVYNSKNVLNHYRPVISIDI